MPYLGAFGLTTLFSHLACKADSRRKKSSAVIYSLMVILVLSIIGGLRSQNVGTDVTYYVTNNFEVAKSAGSYLGYLSMVYAKEPLYLLIVYGVAKLFNNLQILLFVFSAITIACVYKAAWSARENISIPVIMLTYCCFYYNDSLNLVRQHMAMAILLAGYDTLRNRKYKKYLVYVVAASLIHTGALIGLIIIVCHWYIIGRGKRGRYVVLKQGLLLLGAGVAVCGFKVWVSLFVKIGLLSSRYLYYFQQSTVSNNLVDNIIYLAELLMIVFAGRIAKSVIYDLKYLQINAALCLIFLQLARIINYGHRFSMYFGIINIFLLAQIPKMFGKGRSRMIANMFYVVFLVCYWLYIYVVGGVSHTWPYELCF